MRRDRQKKVLNIVALLQVLQEEAKLMRTISDRVREKEGERKKELRAKEHNSVMVMLVGRRVRCRGGATVPAFTVPESGVSLLGKHGVKESTANSRLVLI